MSRSKVKVTRDKNALSAADTPRVRTNGMRSLLTACSNSERAHFVAARGVFSGVVCQFYASGKISACWVVYGIISASVLASQFLLILWIEINWEAGKEAPRLRQYVLHVYVWWVLVSAPWRGFPNFICIFIRPHRSTTYVDAVYCYRPSSVVCLSVGLSQSRVVQKRLNRLRCCLDWGLGWGKESCIKWWSKSPHAKAQFLGEKTCPPDDTNV